MSRKWMIGVAVLLLTAGVTQADEPIDHLVERRRRRGPLRVDDHARAARVEGRTGHLGAVVPDESDERVRVTVGGDQHDLQVAPVLTDEQIARLVLDGEVVRPPDGRPLPVDGETRSSQIETRDPTVALGGQIMPRCISNV